MKNMPIALSAVLMMAACGGGKATTDDCAKAIENTNAVSRDEIKKMNLSDETAATLTSITLKHCTADTWDAKVVTCLREAKNNEGTLKCTDGLTAAQKLAWQNDMAAALPKPSVAPEAPGSAATGAGSDAAGSGSAGSGSSASVDLPAECQDYKAMMARLATCEKLGPARAAYQQAYEKVSTSWAQAGTTPEARAQLAQGCKTTVEAIRQSAAATCGW